MSSIDKIMVALDNMSEDEIYNFLDQTNGQLCTIKIGLEMFCKLGPDFIHRIYNKYKYDIFLDLKLHDIPNTVAKSIHALEGLPIKFLTIHLSGGSNMIEMAVSAAKESLPSTQILGVSFLTSLGEENFLELFGLKKEDMTAAFTRMFTVAYKSSIHGVVLSAAELELVNKIGKNFDKKLIKVCPGIRFLDEINSGNIGDQKRVLDPMTAFTKKADFLVMGRSLTQTKNLTHRIEELKNCL